MAPLSATFFEGVRDFAQGINSMAPDLVFGPRPGSGLGLYHYTDLGALSGIVQSNDLWLTHARYSNDEDESVYGERLARERVQAWTSNTAGADAFRDAVLAALDDAEGSEAYVCCFCEQDNLLGHWRAYGANGTGVSLGFVTDGFARYTEEAEARGLVLRLWKVFYERKTQERIVERAMTFSFAEQWRAQDPAEKALLARDLLRFFIPTFKNPDFAEEREYRLILSPTGPNALPPRYRTGRGMLVPYHVLSSVLANPATSLLPIRSVRVGPGPRKLENARSVEMLLRQSRADAVAVHASDTPYRG